MKIKLDLRRKRQHSREFHGDPRILTKLGRYYNGVYKRGRPNSFFGKNIDNVVVFQWKDKSTIQKKCSLLERML